MLVPYRGRPSHLAGFLPRMHAYLEVTFTLLVLTYLRWTPLVLTYSRWTPVCMSLRTAITDSGLCSHNLKESMCNHQNHTARRLST